MSDPEPGSIDDLGAEDRKLVTLARASRARTQAIQGAAVRDTSGRTYTATTVALPSLRLSALRLAVGMAVSSGAPGLEAAAVLTGQIPDAVDGDDLAAVRDLGGAGIPVFVADAAGTVRAQLTT